MGLIVAVVIAAAAAAAVSPVPRPLFLFMFCSTMFSSRFLCTYLCFRLFSPLFLFSSSPSNSSSIHSSFFLCSTYSDSSAAYRHCAYLVDSSFYIHGMRLVCCCFCCCRCFVGCSRRCRAIFCRFSSFLFLGPHSPKGICTYPAIERDIRIL